MILSLLIVIFLPLLLGLTMIVFFHNQVKELEGGILLSLSYLIGLGMITLLLFYFYFFQWDHPLLWISLGTALLIILLIMSNGRSVYEAFSTWYLQFKEIKKISFRKDWITILLWIIFLGLISYIILISINVPPVVWDEWALWTNKAKILYISGLEKIVEMEIPLQPNYPLMDPFAQVFVYLSLGYFDELLGKLSLTLGYISFLFLFVAMLSRLSSIKIALFFAIILMVGQKWMLWSTYTYADVPFAIYYGASVLFLLYYTIDKKISYLILSALLVALSCWIKNEGIASLGINLTLLVIFYIKESKPSLLQKIVLFLLYLFIPIIIIFPWSYYVSSHGLTISSGTMDLLTHEDLTVASIFDNLSRIPDIVYKFIELKILSDDFSPVWIIFLLFHLLFIKTIISRPYIYLWIIILLNIILYASVYMIITGEIEWHLGSSLYRSIIHYTPITVFFLGLLAHNYFNKLKKVNTASLF